MEVDGGTTTRAMPPALGCASHEVTPAIPASPKVAPKVSKGCASAARKLLREPRFGTQLVTRHGQDLAKFDPNRPVSA